MRLTIHDTIRNGPRPSALRDRSRKLGPLRIRYVRQVGIPGLSNGTPCDRQRCRHQDENKYRDDKHFACKPFRPQTPAPTSISQVPFVARSATTWTYLFCELQTVYLTSETLWLPSRHKQADFEGNTFTEPVVLRALHWGWDDCPGGRGDRGSL